MLNFKKIRDQFRWFKNNPNLIYFDSGATSLKPNSVLDAMQSYYEKYSTNSHNTDSSFANLLNQEIMLARKTIANFLNANPDEIIFTSGATESLNLFAFGLKHLLKPTDEIVVPDLEHASNILPWIAIAKDTNAKLIHIVEKDFLYWTDNLLNKINENTKIVSFSSISNVFGSIVDPLELIKKIKKINPNVLIIVDATQEVQHHQIDLNNSLIDCLAFSVHKMFGPTGVGIAYIKKTLQSNLNPLKYGGGMYLDYDPENLDIKFLNTVEKYEGGTQNIAGILGTKAAIDFINNLGLSNISEYELKLTKYLISKLKEIPNLEIINENSNTSVISFNIKNVNPQDIAYYLGTKNIIVRSGVSCVNMIKHRNKNSSGYVRITLSIYNSVEEIDVLIKTLKEFNIGESLVGLV
ncbi:aminotransferase class V-fold PLP-dependent enzyme [Mycoplasmoides pirum]|uniref:aminotransferase class V-fold PLP-dependent enzyme n=1 Tax=Mycoplasmoides pirum TaxID=2122 RepID=UPI00048A1F1A|nr:aminotransferase class V-fold PLP-dependent enzyme [Mycoplasmoides pirum]